jgi:extradiol dioxygenase family protein
MTTEPIRPFHIAFPVSDLEATRAFYRDALGCGVGREAERWIDFDLFGHQISAHLKDGHAERAIAAHNPVDGDSVPVPHFGVILAMKDWQTLQARLESRPDIRWVVRPRIRFQGQIGEQATMFFLDPSGNALEFKAFAEDASIFKRA